MAAQEAAELERMKQQEKRRKREEKEVQMSKLAESRAENIQQLEKELADAVSEFQDTVNRIRKLRTRVQGLSEMNRELSEVQSDEVLHRFKLAAKAYKKLIAREIDAFARCDLDTLHRVKIHGHEVRKKDMIIERQRLGDAFWKEVVDASVAGYEQAPDSIFEHVLDKIELKEIGSRINATTVSDSNKMMERSQDRLSDMMKQLSALSTDPTDIKGVSEAAFLEKLSSIIEETDTKYLAQDLPRIQKSLDLVKQMEEEYEAVKQIIAARDEMYGENSKLAAIAHLVS